MPFTAAMISALYPVAALGWSPPPPLIPASAPPVHPCWRTRITAAFRGQYRIANAAEYRFYRNLNTKPTVAPSYLFATSSSLPNSPTPTFADGVWWVGVTYFNGFVESDFFILKRLDVSSGASVGIPPSAPTNMRLDLRPNGVIRFTGMYFPLPDGALAATDWAMWYTVDGSEPDPAGAPSYTQTMSFSAGIDVWQKDLPAQADGTTVKILVRTLRDGSPDKYSENTTVLTAIADAVGPAAPAAGEAWRGSLPEDI